MRRKHITALVEKADYHGKKIDLLTVPCAYANFKFTLVPGIRFETKKLMSKLVLDLKRPCDTQQRQE